MRLLRHSYIFLSFLFLILVCWSYTPLEDSTRFETFHETSTLSLRLSALKAEMSEDLANQVIETNLYLPSISASTETTVRSVAEQLFQELQSPGEASPELLSASERFLRRYGGSPTGERLASSAFSEYAP